MSTVEINGSFYSLQRPERYQAWFEQSPEDFVFAVKGGRFITHMKQLRDVDTALARSHDDKLKAGPYTEPGTDRVVRHALEVRHTSFADAVFTDLLRPHGIALVVADSAGTWPRFDNVTADFVYVRLHGAAALYASGYSSTELDEWATKIAAWRDAGHDVYGYFDNDIEAHAPADAIALAERLGAAPAGG